MCKAAALEYQCKLHQAGIWLHPEPSRRMSGEPNKKKGATLRCPGARVALFFFVCQVSLRRAFVVIKVAHSSHTTICQLGDVLGLRNSTCCCNDFRLMIRVSGVEKLAVLSQRFAWTTKCKQVTTVTVTSSGLFSFLTHGVS